MTISITALVSSMNCCCPHSVSASRVFSIFAGRYRKRFEKKGFEPSQQRLLEGLEAGGIDGQSILEIGSGVGHLHQTLLERGASSATGIDLADRMIEEAQHWAEERKLSERTRYVVGDFMEMQDEFEPADITILDKVVCCYPDADGLVHATLAKTRRVYALTYPRDRWYVRAAMGLAAIVMKIIGSDFRPYVHDPGLIETWIGDEGFTKSCETFHPVWLTQVYIREAAHRPA